MLVQFVLNGTIVYRFRSKKKNQKREKTKLRTKKLKEARSSNLFKGQSCMGWSRWVAYYCSIGRESRWGKYRSVCFLLWLLLGGRIFLCLSGDNLREVENWCYCSKGGGGYLEVWRLHLSNTYIMRVRVIHYIILSIAGASICCCAHHMLINLSKLSPSWIFTRAFPSTSE